MTRKHDQSWDLDIPIASFIETCRQFPGKELFTFEKEGERPQFLTGNTLLQQVRILGNVLLKELAAQERVLLVFPQGLEYISSMLACFYANIVAIPTPNTESELDERIIKKIIPIQKDSEAVCIITNTEFKAFLQTRQEFHSLRILNVDEIFQEDTADVDIKMRVPAPEDIALLLYTSGSTSLPKGVILSHRCLMNQVKAEQWRIDRNSCVVSWMPQFHAFGLHNNILVPLLNGASSTILPPESFAKKPEHWIQMIDKYQATHTAAPNFAFDYCCSTLDMASIEAYSLRHLKAIICAGEPIRKETYENFIHKFRALGLREDIFCPLLGLSELSPVASIKPGQSLRFLNLDIPSLEQGRIQYTDEKNKSKSVVSCGEIEDPMQIRIVHPEKHIQCLPEEVGEIWIRSARMAEGYLNRKEETNNTFEAALSNTKEGGFFRTGDLGFIADNHLYVIGREKEVIIIHGKNHHPVDIEWTIKKNMPELTLPIAVFSAEINGQEKVIVVQEIETPLHEQEYKRLVDTILNTVSETHQLEIYDIYLLLKGSIPKTGSGKIQRKICRNAYIQQELRALYQYRSAYSTSRSNIGETADGIMNAVPLVQPEIQEYMVQFLCQELNLEHGEMDLNKNLHGYGIDSILVMKLIRGLEKSYPIKVKAREILEYPTIQLLSAYLAKKVVADKSVAKAKTETTSHNFRRNPLSEVQKGLWLLHKMSPEMNAYNVPICLRFNTKIEIESVKKAFHTVLEQYPILKSVIEEENGIPYQRLEPTQRLHVHMEDISTLEADEVIPFIRNKAKQPFVLEQDSLMRVYLMSRSEQEHFILVVLHHIIFDGSSFVIFIQSFLDAYKDLVQGKRPTVLPPAASYSDFVKWEQTMLASAEGEKYRSYWKQQLSGALPTLELPYDRSGFLTQSMEGQTYTKRLPQEWAERAKSFARAQHTSLSTVLLGAYIVLLNQYSGQEDIIVGMPTMVRPEQRFDKLIGYFVNMLPIRSQMSETETFLDFMKKLQLTVVNGMDHASYPFPALVRELNVPSMLTSSPVFQAVFSYQNFLQNSSFQQLCMPYKNIFFVELVEEIHQEGEYELVLELLEQEEELVLNIKYRSNLFEESTIVQMAERYIGLAEALLENPTWALEEYSLLLQEEKDSILYDWNATETSYPDKCLPELFLKQARKTPDAIAVVYAEESLTYKELKEKSTLLAIYLQHHGVTPDTLVGICMERSLDMMIGLLGILMAGGAYVPLDPDYPEDRLEYMLQDSNASLVITQSGLLEKVSRLVGNNVNCIVLGKDGDHLKSDVKGRKSLKREVQPHHLAYVIYTSGSTGKPKGVMIPHKALTNFLISMGEKPGLTEQDKLLAVTTYCFDIAGLELYLPLIKGAQCHICSSEKTKDAEKLKQEIQRIKPTIMQATPVTWTMLFQAGWKNEENMKVLCGGEALSETLKSYFVHNSCDAWNMFGPTETTIWSTIQSITADKPISIGKPIANTQIYILDKRLRPVPVGLPGELFISGGGLARGYLNQPALTAEKFIDNPFNPGTKLYRTGDLCRWLSDGSIEYMGRMDYQVKIRGFRIELNEVEGQVRTYPGIDDCVVIAKEQAGDKQLVAYCVLNHSVSGKSTLDPKEVRNYLKSFLPYYMIPAFFIELDKLPLTPNGKIDRKELMSRRIELATTRKIYLPQSDVEHQVLTIWKKLLNVDDLSTDDAFFDVGGNSFSAAEMISRIKKMLDCDISVTALFKYPTIKELSAYITKTKSEDVASTSTPEQTDAAKNTASPQMDSIEDDRKPSYPDYFEDSIAIIGISCHFPGAKNHFEFWDNLRAGVESVRFFSEEELNRLGLDREIVENPNYVPGRCTIEGKEYFDPEFFNFSQKNAEFMDPQMKLLLQHSWKAVEDAGYVSKEIPETSVFMSASSSFYQALIPNLASQSPNVLKNADEYVTWILAQGGTIPTMISHKLGFKGPSLFVHSNCSSSLVGLRLASQSLLSGEAKYALVGASTIFPFNSLGYVYQPGLNFSSDGHIKAFDASADGMIGGEGVGVILLKKTLDAVKDGDHIYTILRGVGVNNDGTDKLGFYAPSVKGQAEVIQKTIELTQIHPESISYIETHGTGTKLGDPVEFAALNDIYRRYTTKKQFCGIGSVKTNIGHLDTASGLAGCIKVALSLYHNEIPPSLNYEKPNADINLPDSPFYVVDRLQKWENASAPHRAALSSFGIGGTNAHAIFEQFVAGAEPECFKSSFVNEDAVYLIPLSARNQHRLTVYAHELSAFLAASQGINLSDVSFTLQAGRMAMRNRVAFIVKNMSELVQKLESFANGKEHIENCWRGENNQLKDSIQLFEQEEVFKELVSKWISNREMNKLAELWAKGFNIDWRLLYYDVKPKRISLPTYPFAEERCWAPELETEAARARTAEAPAVTASRTLMFEPAWKEQDVSLEAEAPAYEQRIVLLCEPDEALHERLAAKVNGLAQVLAFQSGKNRVDERFQAYAAQAFESIQSILKDKPEGRVLVQIVVRNSGEGRLFSGLSGLLKTARLENPKFIGQLIEVEKGESAEGLLAKLKDNSRSPVDGWIRYADGQRRTAFWSRLEPFREEEVLPWKNDGVYLITGGSGALGLLVAEEIVRQAPAATLILTGRSPLDRGRQTRLKELEASGASVEYRQGDITDKSTVIGLLESIREECGRVHGIIHCAGVIHDNFIIKKTSEEFMEVLGPKVRGLVHLDEASSGQDLDFFVLFSSISGSLGNPGQADYATANAFMDAYAEYRNTLVRAKQRRGRTLSIRWPLWKEGGMRIDADTEKIMMQNMGITAMQTRSGMRALQQCLSSGKEQVMVMEGEPEKIEDFLAKAVSQVGVRAVQTAVPNQTTTPKLDAGLLYDKTLHCLKMLLGEVTRLSVGSIEANEPLETYGIDSIMITQLNGKLASSFGELSQTLFYEYQTLRALTEYFVRDYSQECMRWVGMSHDMQPVEETSAAQLYAEEKTVPAAVKATAKPDRSWAGPRLAETREPIAIIGMAGKYPRSRNMNEYWENLKAGKDCVTEIPQERWTMEEFFHPDKQEAVAHGKSYSKWGGFIEGFAEFDPLFFNIAPREALSMDPQERLFIEACWEVMEDAGYTREQLAVRHNSRVGVFAGITKTGYELYGPELWRKGAQIFPHLSFSSVANRISYLFNLQGPSMPIDTMCSSSLTAIH
ncbi:non-ribosomal peptide synthetase, partial [Paenibacillus sp. BJ-4]|uniref:non-ribosomal peptide synthetase n=3 Tax=Paenibacillus sp. BJ-4 TaxID=2878097 RepID=UPI001CF015CC